MRHHGASKLSRLLHSCLIWPSPQINVICVLRIAYPTLNVDLQETLMIYFFYNYEMGWETSGATWPHAFNKLQQKRQDLLEV